VGRDGTLWIGTLKGLASWKNGTLTAYPEFARAIVRSFYEDREQTVWFSTWKARRRGSVRSAPDESSAMGRERSVISSTRCIRITRPISGSPVGPDYGDGLPALRNGTRFPMVYRSTD
jgi:hypothetical protein